jgi:hypothetical protein
MGTGKEINNSSSYSIDSLDVLKLRLTTGIGEVQ